MSNVVRKHKMSSKSINQLHGKTFEDLMKASGRFMGSADGGRSSTQDFDIEAKYDKNYKMPTSVKTTKGNGRTCYL